MRKFVCSSCYQHKTDKRESGKSVLQFWNGGANSTYLLLQNLLSGNELVLQYIDMPHQKAKRERELAAQFALKEDIKQFCKHFNCYQPQYSKNTQIRVFSDLFHVYQLSQQLVIMALALSLANDDFHEVHIGNSCENYATITQHKLINAYDFAYRVEANILFPLENTSKETVYLSLKSYDDLLGTNFLGHIAVCDEVFEECDTTFYCEACKEQQKVFQQLKWI